jgi:hypothetical protein
MRRDHLLIDVTGFNHVVRMIRYIDGQLSAKYVLAVTMNIIQNFCEDIIIA